MKNDKQKRLVRRSKYGHGYHYSLPKRLLARLLEYLLWPWLCFIPKPELDCPVRKILILEPHALGDAALLAVMLAPLKARFPQAEIHLLVQPANTDLFQFDPRVTTAHGFSFPWSKREDKYQFWKWPWGDIFRFLRALRRQQFEVGIDSRGEVRSQILMVLLGCRRRVGFTNYLCSNIHIRGLLLTDSLGAVPRQHRTRINMALCAFGQSTGLWKKTVGTLPPAQCEREEVPRNFGDGAHDMDSTTLKIPVTPAAGDPSLTSALTPQLPALIWRPAPSRTSAAFKIVMHTGGGWRFRMWADARWAELLTLTVERFNVALEVVGAKAEKERLDSLRKAVPAQVKISITSLMELVDALQSADLIVCLDSGPMNIAAMLGKPVLALFGPGVIQMYAPISPGSRIVHHQQEFSCAPCSQNICLYPQSNCMHAMGVPEVMHALASILTQLGHPQDNNHLPALGDETGSLHEGRAGAEQ